MDKQLYKYTKKQIKQAFPRYRRVQVGATIKEVEIIGGRDIKRLPMVEFKKVCNNCRYFRKDLHQLFVAVDQITNTVYWNFERIN